MFIEEQNYSGIKDYNLPNCLNFMPPAIIERAIHYYISNATAQIVTENKGKESTDSREHTVMFIPFH